MGNSEKFKKDEDIRLLVSSIPRLRTAMQELSRVSNVYGLDLTAREIKSVVDKAVEHKDDKLVKQSVRTQLFAKLMEKSPQRAIEIELNDYKRRDYEVSAKVQQAALALATTKGYEGASVYLKQKLRKKEKEEKEPQTVLATKDLASYQVNEGRKYWSYLNADELGIEVDGASVKVKDALKNCAAIKDEQKRLERFKDILAQIAEKFRVKPNMKNDFGIAYDVQSSDPDELLTKRSLNCISGSVILGQMTAFAASQVGLQDNISAKVQLVASYTLGNKWDDGGHAMLRVDIKGKDRSQEHLFFDSTNTLNGAHARTFALDEERPNIVVMKFGETYAKGGTMYRLGEALALTPRFADIIKFQDRLFDMHMAGDLTKENIHDTMNRILRMPPIFIAYFIYHLDDDQKRTFFRSFNAEVLNNIKSPALRLKLSALAASVYLETNPKLAREFGRVALLSLRDTIADKSELAKIPMGSLLDASVRIARLMKNDKQLIVNSGIWAYIPYLVSRASGDVSRATAIDARDFLISFYNDNKEIFGKLESGPLLNYMKGILTLNNNIGIASPASDDVLNVLYNLIGINRSQLLASLRGNAKNAPVMGVQDFLKRADSNYILELSFLNIVSGVFSDPHFSMDSLRLEVASSPISGYAVYSTLKDDLSKITLTADAKALRDTKKDFRSAAAERKLSLVKGA